MDQYIRESLEVNTNVDKCEETETETTQPDTSNSHRELNLVEKIDNHTSIEANDDLPTRRFCNSFITRVPMKRKSEINDDDVPAKVRPRDHFYDVSANQHTHTVINREPKSFTITKKILKLPKSNTHLINQKGPPTKNTKKRTSSDNRPCTTALTQKLSTRRPADMTGISQKQIGIDVRGNPVIAYSKIITISTHTPPEQSQFFTFAMKSNEPIPRSSKTFTTSLQSNQGNQIVITSKATLIRNKPFITTTHATQLNQPTLTNRENIQVDRHLICSADTQFFHMFKKPIVSPISTNQSSAIEQQKKTQPINRRLPMRDRQLKPETLKLVAGDIPGIGGLRGSWNMCKVDENGVHSLISCRPCHLTKLDITKVVTEMKTSEMNDSELSAGLDNTEVVTEMKTSGMSESELSAELDNKEVVTEMKTSGMNESELSQQSTFGMNNEAERVVPATQKMISDPEAKNLNYLMAINDGQKLHVNQQSLMSVMALAKNNYFIVKEIVDPMLQPCQTNAVTIETNVVLTQPPIMSTLEQPTKTDRISPTNSLELIGQNLDESLAVLGVTSNTNAPTSLELPITITNPAIAAVSAVTTEREWDIDLFDSFRPITHPVAHSENVINWNGGSDLESNVAVGKKPGIPTNVNSNRNQTRITLFE